MVEAYLTSPIFKHKKREVVEEFFGLEEFRRLVDAWLEAFKSSQEFRDLVDH